MELANDVYKSINSYFSILEHTGYKPDNDVYKLIVFAFIEELLDSELSQYITEKDYNSITNALYCIYGTCMIPYPDYKRGIDTISRKVYDEYRITETGLFRSSDDIKLRVKS